MDMPEIHIFWVYAATEARVRQSYAEIATAANLRISKDPRAIDHYTGPQGPEDIDSARQPQTDIMQMVNSWLQSDASGCWLMIFDSADSNLSLVKAFEIVRNRSAESTSEMQSLAHMLPRSPMGAILVTTRNKKLALDLTDILLEVPRMDDIEAENLVHDKLKHLNSKQVEVHSLVELLGYLPLALVQATAYIQKTSIDIRKYIELYSKDKGTQMHLLGQDFSDLERDQNAENAVLKTWILSFEQIKKEDPQAAELLSIMSFFDAQNIPESLLEVIIPDSLKLVESLATLKAFALVTSSEDNETYDMHRMVQFSMQQWLVTRQESSSWVNKALGMLGTAYGRLTGDTLRNKLSDYYPHTIAALAIESGSTKDSRWYRGFLRLMAGVTLSNYSQRAKAHEFYLEAIQLWTDLLGAAHYVTLGAIVLAARNLRSWAPSNVFYTQELEEWLLRANNDVEIATGPSYISNLLAKVIIAEIYSKSKEWTKAKNILTPILRQREDTPRCQHELVDIIGAARCAMANIYLLEGNLGAAETLLLKVVTFCERVYTREHTDTQDAIDNLASTYIELGWLDKAKSLLEGLLSINRRTCGEIHEHTFSTMQKRAEVYRKLERYEESLGLLEELLTLMQEVLESDDPLCISVIEELAESLHFLDRYEEEVKLREQALAMRRQRQGFDHVETLESAISTAYCYQELRRYPEALDLLKEVVSTRKRKLSDEHPTTLSSMFALAFAHLMMGQVDIALPLYQEVYLLRRRILGDDHVGTREAREWLDKIASRVRKE